VLLLVSKARAYASLIVLYKWKGELDRKVERGNSTRILPETGHVVLNAMKNGVRNPENLLNGCKAHHIEHKGNKGE